MPMTEITSRLSTALADRYRIERRLGAAVTIFLIASCTTAQNATTKSTHC